MTSQAAPPEVDSAAPVAARDAYRAELLALAGRDPRVWCLDTDMGGLETGFAVEVPERYLNLGIAEANMMGMAAGMAAAGLRPYANTISSFAAARACEQIKIDVAGNNLPVRIVVTHSGFSAGHYGPTHHAVEDIAIMRTMPHMTVVVPADDVQTGLAVAATADLPGPLFLRLGRAATPRIPWPDGTTFQLGRAVPLRDGAAVTIVATGPYPVLMAVQAGELLAERGIDARVLALHTVKPIDTEALLAAARQTAGIVTVEDHLVVGGMGGAVAEVVGEAAPCPVRRVGVPDGFHDAVGDELELLELVGVTPERIAAEAQLVLGMRRPA
ncbi:MULTISPECIES: transketolase family protein [Micromonospora]|uniref:Transketolase subunit B n=1 Tax=Micromonospora yangpuensis TaxID=683228 RepID=A0A1C6VHP8_9ACTN|nr:transketolase C-terminal domain-containing protein [Micromonospora yangpuensis]GGL99367.1 transketolase [Micromonospora yangpuensis]SCL65584.1 transketolase subunit B [Micromonospora yangpuensis]